MSAAWVAAIAAIITAVIAVKPAHWLYRLLIGTHDFITDWPRMKNAIADLQEQVADIKAETKPNGGSSMRDVISRAAAVTDDIKDEQSRLRTQIELRTPPRAPKTPPKGTS